MKNTTRTATAATARTNGEWGGMNWIRQSKRLAIYLRDGLACVWCGFSVENGAQLTLDHIKPHVKGGSNHECNLVTACKHCNSGRCDRSAKVFAAKVAGYINHGATAEMILAIIRRNTARKLALYHVQAKAMIADRGGLQNVLTK